MDPQIGAWCLPVQCQLLQNPFLSFSSLAELSETSRGEKLIRSIVKRLSLYLLIFFVSGFPGMAGEEVSLTIVYAEKPPYTLLPNTV